MWNLNRFTPKLLGGVDGRRFVLGVGFFPASPLHGENELRCGSGLRSGCRWFDASHSCALAGLFVGSLFKLRYHIFDAARDGYAVVDVVGAGHDAHSERTPVGHRGDVEGGAFTHNGATARRSRTRDPAQ